MIESNAIPETFEVFAEQSVQNMAVTKLIRNALHDTDLTETQRLQIEHHVEQIAASIFHSGMAAGGALYELDPFRSFYEYTAGHNEGHTTGFNDAIKIVREQQKERSHDRNDQE